MNTPPHTAASTVVTRRTIVQGAAWTVPVIAAAVAVPMATASAIQETTKFIGGPYALDTCTPLTGVKVQAQDMSGAAKPDVLITVTLSEGLFFEDSSVTHTGASQSDGTLILPNITTPSGISGSIVLTASTQHSSPAITTATVTEKFSIVGTTHKDSGGDSHSNTTYPGIPVNAKPIGAQFFQTPSGDIWSTSAGKVATGAQQGAVVRYRGETPFITFIDSSGIATVLNASSGTLYPYPIIPAQSKPLGGAAFQAPNGDIYNGDDILATGARHGAEFRYFWNDDATIVIGFIDKDGVATLVRKSSANHTTTSLTSVPLNSTPIGGNAFQAPNGDIYCFNNLVATGAKSGARVEYAPNSAPDNSIAFIDAIGVATNLLCSTTDGTVVSTHSYDTIPLNCTPIGGAGFQAPNGDIYFQDTLTASGCQKGAMLNYVGKGGTAWDRVAGYITPVCS